MITDGFQNPDNLLSSSFSLHKSADLISLEMRASPHIKEYFNPLVEAVLGHPFSIGELWTHTTVLLCPVLCWQRSEML